MRTKLVSYSLFGRDRLYLNGAIRNAWLVPKIYPGWTTRFYVSQEIPDSVIDELQAHGADVVRKERKGRIDGMFWRFLPAADTTLEAVIVRDVDSRPTTREYGAVCEWLASERILHVMRDHPCHRVVIMGGMWGCRGGAVPDMEARIGQWNLWNKKGHDQDFLRDNIYPRLCHSLLVHSELYAYRGEDCRPFPRPRQGGEFVGCVIDPDRDTLTEEQHAENLSVFQSVGLTRLPPAKRRPKIALQIEQWFRNWRRTAA